MTPGALEYIDGAKRGEIDPAKYLRNLMCKLPAQAERFNLFSNMIIEPEAGKGSPLQGLPFSVKDNICVKGFETRAGSRILEGYKPPFDATVVERMKAAGGSFIGATNMDEFGFGTFSANCAFGAPRNPFDETRSCGGSSGGAAGLTSILRHHVALAESTGGSISCPAAFCGVVGFTPTYGRVSRYGLIDYANSLDKIGLMARAVDDISLTLPIISGKDKRDPTSLAQPDLCISDCKIKSIAIPEELVSSIPDKRVSAAFSAAIAKLQGSGIEVAKVSMPILKYSIPAYYILACAEASTNLAKFCGMRYGRAGTGYDKMYDEFFTEVRTQSFGVEAKRRLMLGTFARMAGYRDQYYMKALKVRRKIVESYSEVFGAYDIIATPTMPLLPPKFDEIIGMSPATVYALDFLTVPPNLAGIPQLSQTMAYVDGLPAGIHFMAGQWEESKLLSMGRVWEAQMRCTYPLNLEGLQ